MKTIKLGYKGKPFAVSGVETPGYSVKESLTLHKK